MDFYRLAQTLTERHNIAIRKKVSGSYGRAYNHTREIAVPEHLGYLGFAIFSHEVGHIVLGHTAKPKQKLRCMEEYEAWEFAKNTFRELGIPLKRKVRARIRRSLGYAKRKALHRGLKRVPKELRGY